MNWILHQRHAGVGGWRVRLALVPSGEGAASQAGWLGSSLRSDGAGPYVLRLEGSSLRAADLPLGPLESRTFALDVDPAGRLWIAPYPADETLAYARLRVLHQEEDGWREEVLEPGLWPQVLEAVSRDEVWIGGNHGRLVQYRRGTWSRHRLAGVAGDVNELDGYNVLDLRMQGPDDGWLVGARGLVARYRQGRWQMVDAPAPLRLEKLLALDVTAAGVVWAVGTGGVIVRHEPGESGEGGWQITRTGTTLNSIDMVGEDDGWAVGGSGTILRFDGQTWQPQPSPIRSPLMQVVMTSATEGWIVGDGFLLRATTERAPTLWDVSSPELHPMLGRPTESAAALDLDGDGDLDLALLNRGVVYLFENRLSEKGARGAFTERPSLRDPQARDAADSAESTFAWGDVDGDGDPDLVTLAGNPASARLWLNRGGLRFGDATERAGFAPVGGSGNTVYLLDLDRDGHLDLYIARGGSDGPSPLGNQRYRGDGTGRFHRVETAGGQRGIERLVLWGDLDGDHDLDAVLPGYEAEEHALLRNDGGVLVDATAGSGLSALEGNGEIRQGLLLDLEPDGDLDLLLVIDRLRLLRNDGKGRFSEEGGLEDGGLADGGVFEGLAHNPISSQNLSSAGDLNHDGFPEILVQTTHDDRTALHLLSRQRDGRYRDVAAQVGLPDYQADGAVLADWDGDGDLDLFLAGGRLGENRMFENRRDDEDFLVLRLEGVVSDRMGIGARIRIWDAGHLGEAAHLRAHREAGLGLDPRAIYDLSEQHFGLPAGGGEARYDLEVTFPAYPRGRRVVLRGVAPGQVLTVHEVPAGLRQLLLARRAVGRALRAASWPLEAAKLALVAAALLAWPRLARRFGGRWLVRRRALPWAVLGGYLLLAGGFAADPRPLVQGGQVAGVFLVLGALALADRRLTAWRSARHVGPYRLLEPLGEGGMGIVYRARGVVDGRGVALKVLHPRRTEQESHRIRFLREARLLTRLDHPNVVRVFDTGEAGGRGYIAMELLHGETLRQRILRTGAQEVDEALEILMAVTEALAYVHALGIVHRDVKSDNVFLLVAEAAGERAEPPAVKLMDFGLARSHETFTVTGLRDMVGTLAYMAPEQLQGRGSAPASDLYSLGVVAYEALTGRLPFTAEDELSLLEVIRLGRPEPPRALRPQLPPALEAIVLRLLDGDPRRRPPSAERLLEDWRRVRAAPAGGPREVPARAPEEALDPAPAEEVSEPESERVTDKVTTASDSWQNCLEAARRRQQQGRTTEAQVLMLHCVAALREHLEALEPAERVAYNRRPDVAGVFELMDRLGV